MKKEPLEVQNAFCVLSLTIIYSLCLYRLVTLMFARTPTRYLTFLRQ